MANGFGSAASWATASICDVKPKLRRMGSLSCSFSDASFCISTSTSNGESSPRRTLMFAGALIPRRTVLPLIFKTVISIWPSSTIDSSFLRDKTSILKSFCSGIASVGLPKLPALGFVVSGRPS